MLAIVGTVPYPEFPLTEGFLEWQGKEIYIGDKRLFVERGVTALISAAL